MIIDCISDLHGFYPELEGGDLLIIAGDLTANDSEAAYLKFFDWLSDANYSKKIVVAGNHDNKIQEGIIEIRSVGPISYLCDSGTEFEGLKIWGSPWTKTFLGMNPNCKAFTVDTEEELAEKWALIPADVDILVTHSPPYGILDKTRRGEHVGSLSLRNEVMGRINPKLHVLGHIHGCGGRDMKTSITHYINASLLDDFYEPVNKPIRVIL